MPKKSCFRGLFGKQDGKCTQALLKFPSNHLNHIYWLLARKFCSKKSLLLTLQILELLVNTLAANEKYPFLNKDNLTLTIQIQLSEKYKVFLNFLLHFWNLDWIFNIMKQKITLTAFVVPKLRTPNTWLDKYLKSPVSEEASTSNMVNVHKHCWNLQQITFIIFIDHCQVN